MSTEPDQNCSASTSKKRRGWQGVGTGVKKEARTGLKGNFFLLLGTYADSWKRTGAVRTKLSTEGREQGGENGERVRGKMTPTLRNLDTDGRK